MKKLLYILLFVPFVLFGQIDDPCYSINDYNLLTELYNPQIEINLISGWNMIGYPCKQEIIVSDAFSSIVNEITIVKDNNGNVYMPEFGFNGIGFLEGGQGYQIKMTDFVLDFSFCQPIQFPTIDGCTDCEAVNFSKLATTDNGSCNYDSDGDGIPDSDEILGCQDSSACNYNEFSTDVGLCEFPQEGFNCDGNYRIVDSSFLFFLENIDLIVDEHYLNVIEASNVVDLDVAIYDWSDDGPNIQYIDNIDGIQFFTNLQSLTIWGSSQIPDLSPLADLEILTLNSSYVPDLSSLSNLGNLQIDGAENDVSLPNNEDFSSLAIETTGEISNLGVISDFINLNSLMLSYSGNILPNFNNFSNLTSLGLFNLEIDTFPGLSDLYNLNWFEIEGCDNLEFFGTISNLPSITSFSISSNPSLNTLPDISNLTSLTHLQLNGNGSGFVVPDLSNLSDLNYLSLSGAGCVLGYPEHLNDSSAPVCSSVSVGDFAHGGIVFSIDETGEHGLVAAISDLSGYYQWGCYGVNVDGADELSVGYGYQNTLDIVNMGCVISFLPDYFWWEMSDVSAAQACINYSSGSYNDWYLPSAQELTLMHESIGQENYNLVNFDASYYWSSSEYGVPEGDLAYIFIPSSGSFTNYNKLDGFKVRPIRSF